MRSSASYVMMQAFFYVVYNILSGSTPRIKDTHPDLGLDITGIVNRNGYRIERHTVTTEDGYVLTLFRIPGGNDSRAEDNKLRPPVLVMHGLFCSGLNWVNTGPDRGLGYVLADRGYDVWLANVRGTTGSRKHNKYTTVDPEFWNFSFHELGIYDLPVLIDYIIDATKQDKISFIGHSQGATAFLVLASERPEYNDKIRIAILMAPVVFAKRMLNPVFRSIATFQTQAESLAEKFGLYELPLITPASKGIVEMACHRESVYQNLCISLLFANIGYDYDELDANQLPLHVGQVPKGIAIKQLFHYTQLLNTDKFLKYDHRSDNFIKYGQNEPPEYDLSAVTAPVGIFYSLNDFLSVRYDVNKLSKALPNVALKYEVLDDQFNHVDFMWAKNVVTKLYNPVIKLMQKFQ